MNRNPRRLASAWSSVALTVAALTVPVLLTIRPSTSPAPTALRPVNVTAHAADPSNPLANRPWGNYESPYDYLWADYQSSTGAQRKLLGSIALQPRARWFGWWTAAGDIAKQLREYISNAQMGNPNTLVQMAFFRFAPWEAQICRTVPSKLLQDQFKRWMTAASQGIGRAHVALIMQPDLPFAFCASNPLVPLGQISWATQLIARNNPNASVYIDAGAADWKKPENATWMIRMAGVRWARGFALNATHFDSTPNQVRYGAQIAAALNKAGITGKHFVVNTDQNLRPFRAGVMSSAQYNKTPVCSTAQQRWCAAVGIPPTADVANTRWQQPAWVNSLAARYVDAYMWFGRPWNNPDPSPHYEHANGMNLARWRGFANLYPSAAPRY